MDSRSNSSVESYTAGKESSHSSMLSRESVSIAVELRIISSDDATPNLKTHNSLDSRDLSLEDDAKPSSPERWSYSASHDSYSGVALEGSAIASDSGGFVDTNMDRRAESEGAILRGRPRALEYNIDSAM